jgi:hypothetical protein
MVKRFASNASANIFSGIVAALYLLAITGIGGRVWAGADFSAWALALSIAAIAPIFAANLSSVVTRRVVEARHGSAGAMEANIVQAGRQLGRHIGMLAVASLLCVGLAVQAHTASQELSIGAFALLLAIMLSTNSWLLLWQARFGQHFADERNWLPALTMASARTCGVAGLLLGLSVGQRDLLIASLGLSAGTWLGLAAANIFLPRPRAAAHPCSTADIANLHSQYRANLRLLSGFAVGAVSMVVIQYGVPPVMAVIAPERFNPFYLASILNTSAASMLGAAISAMLAPMTRWRVDGRQALLKSITLASPTVCAASCLVVLLICWFSIEPVLHRLEVRAANFEDVRAFLAILGLQTVVRNAAAGYAMYIASTGTSGQMAAPLLIEIALTFMVAVPLGWFFGENALLYGLIVAGLLGSLYSSRILASLDSRNRITAGRSFGALLGAQLFFAALWWLIARPGL